MKTKSRPFASLRMTKFLELYLNAGGANERAGKGIPALCHGRGLFRPSGGRSKREPLGNCLKRSQEIQQVLHLGWT
jgi:hypothetical protein